MRVGCWTTCARTAAAEILSLLPFRRRHRRRVSTRKGEEGSEGWKIKSLLLPLRQAVLFLPPPFLASSSNHTRLAGSIPLPPSSSFSSMASSSSLSSPGKRGGGGGGFWRRRRGLTHFSFSFSSAVLGARIGGEENSPFSLLEANSFGPTYLHRKPGLQ